MTRKTISIISYLTIIGWVVSFIIYHNGGRSSFAQYHLKQAFGLGIFGLAVSMLFVPVIAADPLISTLFSILLLGILIILIVGIINAFNQKRKPVPLIGSMFVDRFNFIKY